MASENSDRVTRSKSEQEDLIQRVIEKVLTNKMFLDKMLAAVQEALSSRDLKQKELEDRIEVQEQYSRSNNVRIFGVPETEAEKVEEVVAKLCSEKLKVKVSAEDIDHSHRLKGKEGAHRPIIIRFCRRSVRDEIYRAKSKLRGTSIVIREDLTKERMCIIKNLVSKTSYKDVFTSNGNVFVKIAGNIEKIRTLSDYNKILNKFFGDVAS